MRLLIDAGNTRIKWALVDGDNWLQNGFLPVQEAGKLAQLFFSMGDIQQIWVSNVAGKETAQHISNIKTSTQFGQLHFILAQASQCGVRNGYANPAQLGSDRWAALIAAWHLLRRPCVVVNCGTATTIDTLSGQGEFSGGLIVPGVELMQHNLAAATDQLKPEHGKFAPYPKNTADALYSGAIQASCGAVERQHALLGDVAAPVILSGGAAGALREHLAMPLQVEDNLVLQGLLQIAQETNA